VIEQIRQLLALQQHDIRQQELEKELTRLPEELDGLRADIVELESFLKKEIENLDEVESWKRTHEETLAEEEDRIQKRMQAIDQVQSAKEYVTLQKDLDSIRKRVKDHVNEVLSLMESVEKRRAEVSVRQAEIAEFQRVLAQREELFANKMREIEAELGALNTNRATLVATIDKVWFRKYDFLAKRRFPPVAKAEHSNCLGCNMGIPPQLFNQLYDMKDMIQCPHCTRLLYIEETLG
jgi:uncharacterized protein